MAKATVNSRIKIGAKIQTLTSTLVVTKVLKHSYKVEYLDGRSHADLWSWLVRRNHLGQFVTD